MTKRERKLVEVHTTAVEMAWSSSVQALLLADLELVDEWLSGDCSLEELHLISRLLRKWDHNDEELSAEELAAWRKVYQITNRLIDKYEVTHEQHKSH
jgi:hypothetical protein